jgi:hypothetical protein
MSTRGAGTGAEAVDPARPTSAAGAASCGDAAPPGPVSTTGSTSNQTMSSSLTGGGHTISDADSTVGGASRITPKTAMIGLIRRRVKRNDYTPATLLTNVALSL